LGSSVFEISTEPNQLEAVRRVLEDKGVPVQSAEVTYVPQSMIRLEGKEAQQVLRLVEGLEELEDVHAQFRAFVQGCRPQLDMEKVATGEAWLGSKAQELGLVDELATSDEVIRSACQRGKVLQVSFRRKTSLPERLRLSAQSAWDGIWQPPSPLG